MCVPTAQSFPTEADIGKGVLLKTGAKLKRGRPGNYGFLDFGNGKSGVIDALLGQRPNGCST